MVFSSSSVNLGRDSTRRKQCGPGDVNTIHLRTSFRTSSLELPVSNKPGVSTTRMSRLKRFAPLMEQFEVIDDPVGAAGKTLLLRIVFPVELLPLPDLPRRTMRISFLVYFGGRDSAI